MAQVSVTSATEYTLPDCGYTAPGGKVFIGWTIGDGTEIKPAGEKITVTEDITLTAHYDSFAALKGYKLCIDGDIGIIFYMEIAEDLANDVAAKEMTAVIKAQLYSGEDAVSDEYTYSVKAYAEYILANAGQSEEYSNAVPLVKAMLNYGAAAQVFFGVNTGNLANDSAYMTDADRTVAPITDPSTMGAPAPIIPSLPEGVTLVGASAALDSDMTLSLYFTSDQTLRFSCLNGYTVTPGSSGKYQIARISGINAKDMNKLVGLTVSCSGGATDVQYSILNYCQTAMNGSYGSLEPVVTALYRYHMAVKNY